jgi:4-amino-4-deoxy-L-arabinose transferase-like glycosyltransferase
MKMRLGLTASLGWFAAIAAAFAYYQFSGLEKVSPFGDYLLSVLKVLAILVVAAALGLRLVAPERPRPRDVVVGMTVGLALLGIAALALAAVKMLRPYLVWPLVVAAGALVRRQLRALVAMVRRPNLPALTPLETALAGLLAFAALLTLANCLAPITATDALVYHLNIPKIYTAAAGLVKMPYNVYANMPHYGEMLYALFYVLAGETGARLAYFAVVVGATLAVYVLARRFAPRNLAMGAAAVFLVQPLVIDGRIVCNVDVLLAYFYISAIVLLLDGLSNEAHLRQVLPVGLVAGFMLGVKYTAIAPVVSLVALPLVASARRPAFKPLMLAGLVALAVFAPWLVKNEAYVGNPFYPVLERTFDGANWDPVQETELVRWQRNMGMGRDFSKYLALPFNVSTRGKPAMNYMFFDGTLTPLVLILFPLVFLRRSKKVLTLAAMAAALFLFWSATSQQLRFLLPAVALGAALGAAGLAHLATGAGPRAVCVVLGLAVIVMAGALIVPDQYGTPFAAGTLAGRLPVDLGIESRQQYLARSIQSFTMFDYVKRTLPPREPIFLVWENRTYFLDNPHFADSFFEASAVMRIVAASRDADDLARAVRRMGFRYVIVNDMLGEFFSRYYPPAEVARLKDFVANHLEAVTTSNRMTLYILRS